MSTPRPSLRDSLADYLNLRRALGFQLANAGRLLEQFVGYLERHGIDTVTTEHAVRWATLPADASRHWLAIRVSVVRGFTVYLHSIDSSAEVVPAGLIRPGACRATPYLYSESEIGSLVEAAGGLRPRLRAATYQSLISLLAISGRWRGAMTGCGKERISSNELAVVGNNLHPTCEQRITGIGAMMNTNTADGDPVSVAIRSIHTMASGDRADFDAVFHPDAVDRENRVEPPSSRVTGPAGFYSTAVWLRAAFAGLHYDIHHALSDGDLVAVNSTMNGRHVAPFVVYRDDGEIDTAFPPTRKTFAMAQTHWFRMQDGKVIEHWAVRDDLGQARQLGWLPPTPAYLVRMAIVKRRVKR